MWTFDVQYVTQNNRSSYFRTIISNATRVFYDCSKLRDLRQMSTQVHSLNRPLYISGA